MNKSYKVIWNASLQDWVVTSEFASGKKKKSKTSSISGKLKGAAALITLIGSFAPFSIGYASDIAIPGFTPEKNSHLNGQIIVSSDDTLFNNGSMGFNSFQQGELSYKTSSIKDLAAAGKITSGNEYLDDNTLALGGKLKQISYIDAVTHTNKTTTVYDNDIIAERSISDSNTTTNISVGEGQYVNTNLATVLEGGKLTVKVGETDSDWINNPANNLNAIIKESSIFLAQTDDTSSTDAVINYDAKTRFYVGDAANNPTANNVSFNANNYQGQIKSKIGNWNVHDINSFKQYNAALISAIEGGKLSPEDYETQIALAYTSVKETIVIDPSQNIPDGDAALSSSEKETNSYIKGQGKRSVINISSDSVIVGQGQTSIVKVEDGATVNNDGRLAVGFNNSHGGYAVFAENGTLNNQGVIDAGYTDLDGKGELGRRQTGIRAAKSSLINNNGIVNVTGPDAYQAHTGISVVDTSEVVNNGVINVSVTRGAAIASADDDYGYGSFGIDQTAGTKAVNNGDIYLGRKAQYSLSDASENIDTFWRSVGVSVRGANAYFENGTEGNITVGDDAQNSIAILARKDSQGDPTVIQNGTITINGHYSGDAPLENIGILVDGGANDVTNSESGSITLNGTNGIGIKVLNTSQATNAGVLNVNGGADAASGTRNFGIWVEGVGSRATTTGLINLTGDGAIAIHARDGAVVNVNDAGTVNFVNGRNQTGYFVYGKGSTININNTMPQNLSTIDSTLYRIDGGATYSGNGAILTASGKGSTLLLATGKGSDIDTTGMILTASGDGATAVKVEGGAHAKIDATTNIDLTGVGATAGSVQGA
ncbi:ESPR domain-containing protein, partial [Enterobacteriaceae bacterium H11S18]|uniref:ESPR domain-containing protein n=1 Tax=Dryocola clanedunensis TaxID=2925396 RepID=UPI0022F094D9